MRCDQLNELLVDYLYGELKSSAKKRLDKHLAGCSDCAKLVTSYSRTLKKTRASLAGPLAEDPPSRVRFRAIAAAKEYAATEQKPQSFLSRLLRIPWLLPTCGAAVVGILTFFVYVNKGTELPGQKPAPLNEEQVQPAPAAKEAPSLPTPVTVPAERHRAKAAGRKAASSQKRAKRLQDNLAGSRPPEGETKGKDRDQRAKKTATVPSKAVPRSRSTRSLSVDRTDIDDLTPPPSQPHPKPAAAHTPEPQAESKMRQAPPEQREFAQPPPARSQSGAGAPPAPPAPRTLAPSAPTPNAAPLPSRKRAERHEEKAEAAPAFAPSEVAADMDEELEKPAAKDDQELNASIKNADRLFTQRRWAAAAEAYRGLLRRYPNHSQAPSWRGRLAQALAGLAREQPPQSSPPSP